MLYYLKLMNQQNVTVKGDFSKLIFIFFIILLFTTIGFSQQDSSDLQCNVIKTEGFEEFNGFEMIQPSPEVRVFITGENHAFYRTNADLEFKMFKYLHKTYGVNTLMMEFGFSRGYVVNEYVQTGDTMLLAMLRPFSHPVYIRFYKRLHDYNNTLPDSNKIKILGADVERFTHLSLQLLVSNMPDIATPGKDSVDFYCEGLRGFAKYDLLSNKTNMMYDNNSRYKYNDYYRYQYYSDDNTLQLFIVHFNKNTEAYKDFLGSDFLLFEKVIKSLEDYYDWQNYNRKRVPYAYIFREQQIYNSFISFLNENPKAKVYAQFGRCHTVPSLQEEACSWYDFRSVAERISNTLDYENSLLTMGVFYPKHYYFTDFVSKYKVFEDIASICKKEKMYLVKVPDNKKYNTLYNDYQYVFINNYKIEEDNIDVEEDDSLTLSKFLGVDVYPSFSLYGSFGHNYFDFKSLNNILKEKSFNSFTSPMQSWNVGYRFATIPGGFSGIDYHGFILQQQASTNAEKVSLQGFYFRNYTGIDIIKIKPLEIAPEFGITVGNITLQHFVSEEGDPSNGNTLFGDHQISKYNNMMVGIDGGMSIKVYIGPFSIGVRSNYMWDFSNKHWKHQTKPINSSPKTSFSGFYISGEVGWSIFD
ncbi:MAG: erythromycin esterase family protein [Bacteroidales bacterium]|nr:erythromycin esterase family protein [Bacteroidales bacterium]